MHHGMCTVCFCAHMCVALMRACVCVTCRCNTLNARKLHFGGRHTSTNVCVLRVACSNLGGRNRKLFIPACGLHAIRVMWGKTDPFVGERVDWHLVLFSFEYVSMSRHLSSRWELHSISLHTVNCIMQNGLNKFTVNDHIVCIQLDLHCRIVVIVAIIHTILN